MEDKMNILEPLLEKAENYAKTSFELYKLKTVNKSANIISDVTFRGIILLIFSIFIITLNIGLSLWLGELLEKTYYGFFCVAGFYGVMGLFIVLFMRKCIKKRVSNSVISQVLN